MIDLRSDTVTRPDDAMREAARTAEVGDDVYGEDPTVNELQRRAAEILGVEATLLVPSGTMGNQIAARVHTDRGQEVVCERDSHIYRWELGGLAQHAGLQTRPIEGDGRGVLDPTGIRSSLITADGHRAGTGLLALENTHNAAGGTAIAPDRIAAAAAVAHDHDIPVHLDGARLWNAAVALDASPSAFTRDVDSVMCCLSKGLGAPVGSVLGGSEAFIDAAHRVRKLLGGGMRQAGIIAGPGLAALENRAELAVDHRRAAELAAGLDELDGLSAQEPETNIVLVETEEPAADVVADCETAGVGCAAFDDHLLRFTTHRDLAAGDVQTAIERISARG